MKTLYKFLVIAFLSSLALSCNEKQKKTYKQNINESKVAVDTVKKTYQLKKFNQSCCKNIVEFSLKRKVEGFIKSESDTEKGQVTVWFDNQKNTEKDIEEAINKTPYKIEKKIQ
ncbi:heavy-metal-associated domain-containing protein [Zunongwangia profunda]|uniref:heavy-metal-associated domain-containing protein n=1 Tax=Zunongwangia profunda TaxID=398743 RepID=UPI001D194D8D|nr:hypothetical protein [Zunongwangia profunda]MCC4227140.1 hypothetical protein [Zunongwangia profunda]|tara:strand:+ start:5029 stop:5370 length:342 start_codon:yes stop_codon:yes gene_type:complete